MKLLILILLALAPLSAGKKDLVWEHAVVESNFRQLDHGAPMPFDGRQGAYVATVHESIYIDAGEWLYHVTRTVTSRTTFDLRDGAKIDVAQDGKNLLMRVGSKQYSAHIEQKSRAGKHVTDPASRR